MAVKEQDVQIEHASAEHDAHPASDTMATKSSPVDTVHNDEAMKVFAAYTGDENWDAAEEKQLRKKIDRHLLPILCLTYALQYYDKGMISQAVSNVHSHNSSFIDEVL